MSRFSANAYEAFKRHIDIESSPYREVYRQVMGRLASEEEDAPFTLRVGPRRSSCSSQSHSSPRLNVIASNGAMLTGSLSSTVAISRHCPS